MSNKLDATIATYDQQAQEFSNYFRSLTARNKDIDAAFNLLGESDAKRNILEIGCGDGRDAEVILEHHCNYVGFDISKELIKIAKQHVPDGKFEIGDARTYKYSSGHDIVFAFASLLHLDKQELQNVIRSVHESLKPGGVFYISLKMAESYQEFIKKDKFGERLFYLYSPADIHELVDDYFSGSVQSSGFITGTNTEWFEAALVKR